MSRVNGIVSFYDLKVLGVNVYRLLWSLTNIYEYTHDTAITYLMNTYEGHTTLETVNSIKDVGVLLNIKSKLGLWDE